MSEDLISRQAAIDAVLWGITYAKAINKDTGEVMELFKQGNEELTKAVDRIKELPSVQERKGRWIEAIQEDRDPLFRIGWTCTSCGKRQTYGHPKFCPNCGAHMEGAEDAGRTFQT